MCIAPHFLCLSYIVPAMEDKASSDAAATAASSDATAASSDAAKIFSYSQDFNQLLGKHGINASKAEPTSPYTGTGTCRTARAIGWRLFISLGVLI